MTLCTYSPQLNEEIRERYREGDVTQVALADEFNISRNAVRKILNVSETVCNRCGSPIPLEELEHHPGTVVCKECRAKATVDAFMALYGDVIREYLDELGWPTYVSPRFIAQDVAPRFDGKGPVTAAVSRVIRQLGYEKYGCRGKSYRKVDA